MNAESLIDAFLFEKVDMSNVSKEYFPADDPDDINGGDCHNWAWASKLYHPKADLYQTRMYGGHCWLKLGSEFYDAENPKGTKDFSKIFPEAIGITKTTVDSFKTSPKEFLRKWRVGSEYKKLRKL